MVCFLCFHATKLVFYDWFCCNIFIMDKGIRLMNLVNNVPVFLGMISGVAAFVKTIHYFSVSNFSKEVKKYELLKEIKNLTEEDEKINFPMISMAMQCLSKREMTLEEMKWFIYTANASKHLRTYSEQHEYIIISKDRKSFTYNDKFSSKVTRFFELSKLLFIYSFLAGFGLNLIINEIVYSDFDTIIIYGSISMTCIVFGLFYLWKFFTLFDSRKSLRHRFISNFKDDVKFILKS
jgi:hypothetical protein